MVLDVGDLRKPNRFFHDPLFQRDGVDGFLELREEITRSSVVFVGFPIFPVQSSR